MTRPIPRVSIGMPVYNGEVYLAEAIESLLAQTFTDIELIISDNHSEDGTEEICRRFAVRDDRVRYIRNDLNRGAGWNHNKVILESRGPLFKLACYDDVCSKDMIESCVRALDEHPDAILAYPKTMMMMRGDMRELKEYRSEMDLSSPITALRFGDLIDEAPPSFPLFGVVRMSALQRIPWFESYKASDRVVLIRLALVGPLVQTEGGLFYYRWHDNNASHLMSEPGKFYTWWNPAKGSGRVFPETRLLYEYVRSLWTVPMSMRERRQCAREIRLWYQAQKPLIKRELRQVFRFQEDAALPRPGFLDRLERRARRRKLKQQLYASTPE